MRTPTSAGRCCSRTASKRPRRASRAPWSSIRATGPPGRTWRRLRRKQERYEEAVEQFRKVLAKDAGNALAHAGLGVSLLELDRHEEALASMDGPWSSPRIRPKSNHSTY